jgi:hypothetical protein
VISGEFEGGIKNIWLMQISGCEQALSHPILVLELPGSGVLLITDH